MPNAAEYEVWAWRLGALADELTALTGPLVDAASPDVIIGGMVAVSVDVAVRAAQANSLDAAGRLNELADECRRRAEVCAEYATAMSQYEQRSAAYRTALGQYLERVDQGQAIGPPPSAPTEPARPYPWVER